jgi:hypothetical protein
MAAYPPLKKYCNAKVFEVFPFGWNINCDSQPLVELNGTTFTIRDNLIANYVKIITRPHEKDLVLEEIQLNVMKVCNLEKILAKISAKESPKKKNKPNEFLKFFYNKSIHTKLMDIINKTEDYFPKFDFASYDYTIFEAIDTPTFYVIEKRPKNAFANVLCDEPIYYVFVYNDIVLLNFSESNTMRF